ncbi:hypothetical protein ACQ3HE_06835 [Plantibacter auratus]|uniref:hypothetical protein n=1 Tax=Plantibacter auratus TaxID=272914 RepID=UPI003D3371CE
MNALERLEAAITKLEAVKAVTPGTWEIDTNAPFSRDLVGIFVPECREYAVKFDDDEQPKRALVDSIITLHRTIDAQLAILRTAKYRRVHMPRGSGIPISDELALADAILGGA